MIEEGARGPSMGNADLNWIANFIWGIADDVLRDVYVQGKKPAIHLYGQEINAETYAITLEKETDGLIGEIIEEAKA
jgi:type I restriction-modification system DNA methylase subunit